MKNNLRFVRRQVQEPIFDANGSTETYRTVIKLILQERHMDGVTEVWDDVPIEKDDDYE